MRFFASVINLVRRRKTKTLEIERKMSTIKKRDTSSQSQRSETAIITQEMFRSPVLWKTADGKWHRHQLHVSKAHDRTHWFSLTRNGVEVALHSSSQLMHSAFDQTKQSVHLIFVSGVLSLRFPGQLQTEQYFAWAAGVGIRPCGSIFPAKLARSLEGAKLSRRILLVTKDSSLVIVDAARHQPLLFTTAALIRAVTVRGTAVALLSAIPGNDYFFECEMARDLRSWYEMNTVRKQRQKMLHPKVSKPRSRVGKPRMGTLATRRKKLSEASFEVFRRYH